MRGRRAARRGRYRRRRALRGRLCSCSRPARTRVADGGMDKYGKLRVVRLQDCLIRCDEKQTQPSVGRIVASISQSEVKEQQHAKRLTRCATVRLVPEQIELEWQVPNR